MFSLIKYIKGNYFELFITFLIFTNLFPIYFPNWLYYVGLGVILLKMLRCRVKLDKNNTISFILIGCAFLSSLMGGFLDFRLLLFILIIYITYPAYTSLRWHMFKKKLLKNFFIGYAFVTLISLFAKVLGINNRLLKWSEDELAINAVHEFSGFASHPMWVSCAAALSALYFVYMFFTSETKSKFIKGFYCLMFFVSIYIIVISASRSALGLTIICTFLLLRWSLKKISKIAKYIVILGVASIIAFPILQDNMGSMIKKQNYQQETGKTSRDEKWGELIEEFKESPIIGVGFAVHGYGNNKATGRYETGSGWLAILGQMGMIGFVTALLMWKRAITPLRILRHDKWMIMIYCAFIFFSIHSILEGYMIQCGWYLCLVCWMIVGVLIENKKYYKFLKGNPVQ